MLKPPNIDKILESEDRAKIATQQLEWCLKIEKQLEELKPSHDVLIPQRFINTCKLLREEAEESGDPEVAKGILKGAFILQYEVLMTVDSHDLRALYQQLGEA